MKKKGFTLIELLATIVVIAMIAIITAPTITGVIDKAKKGSFKASVLGLMESVDIYKATNTLKYDESDQIIFNCDGEKCQTEEGNKLSIKGEVPISGQIILKKDGTTEAYYLKSNEYCALGGRTNLDVQKDCTKLDITEPEIILSRVKTATNEIVISITTVDIESGIKEIEYSINDKKEIENYDKIATVEKNKTFYDLENSKEYKIVVTVTNGNDNKASKEITLSTLEMGTTTVKLTNTPSSTQNGYLKSQVATLEYSGAATSPYYYVKTTRAAMATATTTSCGTGTTPGTCTTITSTTSLTANTWYRYTSIPTVTYNVESDTTGTIYAAVGDGTNITATATGTLDKIDTTSPSLTLGTAIMTTKSISIPLTMSDNKSGIAIPTCKYSTTDGNYTSTTGVTVSETNCTINNIKSGTTYYYQVCVADKVGNTETCKSGNTATNAIGTTTVKLTNTPSSTQNGYLKSQVATLEYSGAATSPYYYVKTTRAASATATTTSCGTGTTPGNCSTITSTTSLDANVWYRYTSIPTVTYNVESDTTATIYAAVGDGKNITETASATLDKIDTTSPSSTTVTYNGGANTCTWKNNYDITLSASDAGSGLSHYEIDWDGDGIANATTGSNFVPWNGFSSCTVRFRAVDKLGNVSGWTSEHHIHMDTQAPTHTNWWWGEVTKDVARLYIQVSDNVGVPGGMSYDGHNAGVFCPTSTATGGYGNWVWFQGVWDAGANAYRCDITPATFGHYNQTYITHLYMWDYAGNGGYYNQTSVGIPAFNSIVATSNWRSSVSSNNISVQNIWNSVDNSYVTNSNGTLTFTKAATIEITYTIKAFQWNYYCITQGHIRHNGVKLVSLGGIYWNAETISTSGTKTITVAAGDTIDFYGCADYYSDDTDSYLSANITIKVVG